MTQNSDALDEQIQLAIDAAAAANDATADLATLKEKAESATNKLDKFVTSVRPLLLGTLLGGGLAALLGAVVIVTSARELGLAREATRAAVQAMGEVSEASQASEGTFELSEAALAQIAAARNHEKEVILAAMAEVLASVPPTPVQATLDTTDLDVSQMLGALADLSETQHEETREAVQTALSELQLALTRVLASAPVRAPLPPDEEKQPMRPQARPEAASEPRVTATRRAPPPPSRPRPEPNPFSYP